MNNFAANITSSFSQFYKTNVLAMVDYSVSGPSRLTNTNGSFSSGGFQFKKIKRFVKGSPYVPFIVVAVVVVLIGVVFITKATKSHPSQQVAGASVQNTQQMNVPKPVAQETLNKEFDFPLKDANGKEVSKFAYEIQSAEEDNQIIIKGQVATAIAGKTFLLLNLKITNNYDKDVQLNTRDYVRLIVDDSSDRLAADVHNDPVDVQAISTKYTRIGFPIDLSAKNLKLEVGEIDGPKQTIQLNLQWLKIEDVRLKNFMKDYSTKEVNQELLTEIIEALQNIRGWGSVEIIVQDYKVVQITERNIKKTTQVQASVKTRSWQAEIV